MHITIRRWSSRMVVYPNGSYLFCSQDDVWFHEDVLCHPRPDLEHSSSIISCYSQRVVVNTRHPLLHYNHLIIFAPENLMTYGGPNGSCGGRSEVQGVTKGKLTLMSHVFLLRVDNHSACRQYFLEISCERIDDGREGERQKWMKSCYVLKFLKFLPWIKCI